MPIFVSPPPFGVRLDGGQGAMTHRRRGFVLPVVPHSPVIFSAVATSETQRASRSKHRLLSAHDRQIYGVHQRRIEDFVLCCGLVPTIPRLKSACPLPFGTGQTCTPTRAFASGLPLLSVALASGSPSALLQPFRRTLLQQTLPSAILPLRPGGSGLCMTLVS